MKRDRQGFTMLAVLAALFLLALSLQGVMWVVSTQTQRERELELLRVGVEIREGIGRYVEASPGAAKAWPPSLEALLDDKRMVARTRHLRRVYADPMNRKGEWGIVSAPGGGVAGVYSQSSLAPIRTGGTDLALFGVAPSGSYSGWQFVYQPVPNDGKTP